MDDLDLQKNYCCIIQRLYKSGSNLAESSKEGYGYKMVLMMMMIMMIKMIRKKK
jgi:hypothetical protein